MFFDLYFLQTKSLCSLQTNRFVILYIMYNYLKGFSDGKTYSLYNVHNLYTYRIFPLESRPQNKFFCRAPKNSLLQPRKRGGYERAPYFIFRGFFRFDEHFPTHQNNARHRLYRR